MNQSSKLNVAIVYDRVNKFGGAERVLLVLHEMFPDAPLYTSVYDEENAKWALSFPKIYTSFLQNIPFAKKHNEHFGWLTPLAFEGFDFKKYDLVISVTSEAAKGIITNTNTKHICYMLTPTRYLWSGYEDYFKNPIFRFISKPVINYLRWWDIVACTRPDKIIAISTEVKNRIKKYYKRDSEIIYPPVDDISSYRKNSLLRVSAKQKTSRQFLLDMNQYYLYVGRLVKYKKVDLLVNTFNELKLPLLIVGTGVEEKRLKALAKGNIKFLGAVSDDELVNIYIKAKAFLMPQDEDFGITSVEAQSFAVPVLAYKSGGALDTVVDGKTGFFFDSQTKESLKQAIKNFDTIKFDKSELTKNANRFSTEIFKEKLIKIIK